MTVLKQEQIRQAVRAIFGRPAHLQWYCRIIGVPGLEAETAVSDFFKRSEFLDISPTRFFDPAWFRSQYRVNGINAFLGYMLNEQQRLARPSPLFLPRWYARANGLLRSAAHPFLYYLTSDEERSPHPLLDVQYLAEQDASWQSGSIVLKYLTDPSIHHLKPHPLFDSAWYLETNPDVAEAQMNPLEHYLYFGSGERRTPNRFFNVAWYRDVYFNDFRDRQASRIEPLH